MSAVKRRKSSTAWGLRASSPKSPSLGMRTWAKESYFVLQNAPPQAAFIVSTVPYLRSSQAWNLSRAEGL